VSPIKGGTDYRIRLSMRNNGEERKKLSFKIPMCEFIIKKGEEEIWRKGIGEEGEIVLEPDQRYELVSIWDQYDREGKMVEAGEYRIIAWVNHDPPYSIATRLRVRE
jgi:hypothetical protein